MTLCLVLFLVVLSALGYVMLVVFLERLAFRAALGKISSVIAKHEKSLVRRRFQTVRCDQHGNVLFDDWAAEINSFIAAVLKPRLTEAQWRAIERRRDSVVAVIEEHVARSSSREVEALESVVYPAEYDRYCAAQMRKAGWTASLNKAVGGQAIDVIAKKEHVRLLLKCKWYTRPVGSNVVQDLDAARGHEAGEIAAVVSNAGYTAAARQFAAANRVMLLHHADLRQIDKRLSKTRAINTRRQIP
jgi:restriction system protein